VPAGVRTLSALAAPMNIEILVTLADSPRSAAELLAAVGDPPRTTAQKRLRELTEFGALRRRRRQDFPRQTIYELTPDGARLLQLAEAVRHWLAGAPKGRAVLGSPRAREMVHALVGGWSSSIITLLADSPRSLTDLDRLVDSVPYPSLERRLVALREIGLVKSAPAVGRGTPYEATDWLRRAAAPLLAAAAFEHEPSADPLLRASEMRAVLLLALPLVRLPLESHGTLVLAIYPEFQSTGGSDARTPTGATLEIRAGRVVRCVTEIDETAPNWVLGTPGFWAEAALRGAIGRLRIGGGTPQLGTALVTGVYDSLGALDELSARTEIA
jgi:DNA-binding HxlR family transcriptional regulator